MLSYLDKPDSWYLYTEWSTTTCGQIEEDSFAILQLWAPICAPSLGSVHCTCEMAIAFIPYWFELVNQKTWQCTISPQENAVQWFAVHCHVLLIVSHIRLDVISLNSTVYYSRVYYDILPQL